MSTHAAAVSDLPDDAPEALAPEVGEALALAAERVGERRGDNGERLIDHARGTVGILQQLHADETAQLAAALFGAGASVTLDDIDKRFGRPMRQLVDAVRQVIRLRDLHRGDGPSDGAELEALRRMTLAMAADVRVVLVRLASRLQTLRYHASIKRPPDPGLSRETLQILAPLANRLGLWQLKWELEDFAFRFLEPDRYKAIAGQLEEKRREREDFVQRAIDRLRRELAAHGIPGEVTGRPKHIYSIHAKMKAKGLSMADIHDLRALRVIVPDVPRCYEALSLIHSLWTQRPGEYDDYIARPKPNGYQSLHTVVQPEDGRSLEVQIRTPEMHRHAEYGVASHWAYKERTTGTPGASHTRSDDEARVAWVRQLLAWQREVGTALGQGAAATTGGDRIYALTPQGRVIELPAGATPVDFAYHVHTDLGHRCRGARVDGQMVPLNTPLANGQTVEIVTARQGSGNEGPSRDWLNAELGYVRSQRVRGKVRQWFNAIDLARDIADGRARVERVLQREGRTALSFEELASRLDQETVDALFIAVAREEIGPRALEEAVRGRNTEPPPAYDVPLIRPASRKAGSINGVLVVGVDLLLTQLARCCRPAPPDPIAGFVTKGRGVSVHRLGCRSFARMRATAPERVLETDWGTPPPGEKPRGYPVDVVVQAGDRQGLLRDVSEAFTRVKINVTAVNTLSRGQTAHMQFTVEVPDIATLATALRAVADVPGVFDARRRPA